VKGASVSSSFNRNKQNNAPPKNQCSDTLLKVRAQNLAYETRPPVAASTR